MRWHRRLLITGLALVISGVMFATLVLPAIARRQVLAALRSLDPAASYRFLEVSPWRLRVAGLALGETPWLSADFAEITFDPLMLWRGRVDRVTVTGLRWRVGVRDGVIDWGFRGADDGRDAGLPADVLDRFGRIDMPGATVIIDHGDGDGDTQLHVRASLVREGAGARLNVQGGTATTAGTDGPLTFVNATLALDATIDARLRPGPIAGSVRADRVEVAGTTLRDAVLEIEGQGVDGAVGFRAQATGEMVRDLVASGTVRLPKAFPGTGEWTFAADLAAGLVLTPAMRAWLLERGVEVDGDEPVEIAGVVEGAAGDAAGPSGRTSWSARVRGARAVFDGLTIAHAGTGARAEGVRGSLDIEATIDDGGLDVRILPASRASARRLVMAPDTPAPGGPVLESPASGDALTLTIGEPGGSLVRSPGDTPESAWAMTAPVDLNLSFDTVTAMLPTFGAAVAQRVTAVMGLLVAANPDGLSVDAGGPGSLTLASLRADDSKLATGRVDVVIEPLGGAPLVTFGGGAADFAGTWRAQATGPVSFERSDASGRLTGVGISGAFRSGAGTEPLMNATATIADGTVRVPGADLLLEGIRARVPFGRGPTADAGSFAVTTMTRGGRALGRSEGHLAVRDGRLEFAATADLPGGAKLDAHGALSPGGAGPRGEVHVEAPAFDVSDPGAFARLLGLASNAKVGGRWSMAADFDLAEGKLESTARVEMRDASFTLPDQELEATAVAGIVNFDRLDPLATPGAQHIGVGAGRIGSVEFRGGSADVRLDGSGNVCVDAANVVLGDGARVSATPFCVDPDVGAVHTTLVIEDMTLSYWLPLLTKGRATGDGLLRGRVPIVFRPHGASRITLGEGSLEATPAGGWIRAADAAEIAVLLEQSDPRFRTDETMRAVKQRLIDALSDYAYDALRFDLVPERDGLMLRVFTKGRGRQGSSPQEIGGLTVNVHDIDGVISGLLSVRRAIDQDSDRALERFFNE